MGCLGVARRDDDTGRFAGSPWVDERARLARELIDVSGGDETSLHDLQRRALLPIELRLDDLAALTPTGLVNVAVDALHRASR